MRFELLPGSVFRFSVCRFTFLFLAGNFPLSLLFSFLLLSLSRSLRTALFLVKHKNRRVSVVRAVLLLSVL